MAQNRRLATDRDFQEAMEREIAIRVFKDDHMVDSGGTIIEFNDATVVIQTGVGDISYHKRESCEFFEMRKR